MTFVDTPERTAAYYAPQAQRKFTTSVQITTADGRTFEDVRDHPHGHPKNPLSDRELEAKFRAQAGAHLADMGGVLDRLWNIEKADDLADVLRHLTKNVRLEAKA
jgi:2-methylcitrate dehydratase